VNAAAGNAAAGNTTAHPLRMKDLCARTGLQRQAVHFYIQQGLVPAGAKTSRNMAWYSQAHVDRILLVRKLQRERFLPLDAIKALLDERDERFAPAQQDFLRQLRADLRREERADEAPQSLDEVVASGRITADDVERLARVGVPGIGHDEEGRLRVSGEALPIVDVLGQLRALGFTDAAGFRAEDVLIYERAVTALLMEEAALVSRGLSGLPPAQAADRIARALPLVHELIARLHRARIDQLLDSV